MGKLNLCIYQILITQEMFRSFIKLGSLKSFFGKAAKAVVGQMAPAFSGACITNSEHSEVSLSDFEGKYVVLFFYPLDFTFVCPTEIVEFSNRHDEFEAIGAQVVGCSTGSQYSKEAWCNMSRSEGGIGNITYPLLADPTHNVSKAYGVYLPELGFPLRGTFIIDGSGTLRHLSHNDLPVGRSVDEVLRLVQGFQHSDETGEVVPCSWQPGDQTMDPDHGSERTESYWE